MAIKYFFKQVKAFIKPSNYSKICYSQEGEDILLARIIWEVPKNGFFVDVGAHHPKKFSNTYFFYKLGWRGINIDAMPGSMDAFKKHRPQDINLEVPLSDVKESLTYYMFNYPELNTLVESHAKEWDGKQGISIVEKRVVQTSTLTEILDKYKPENINIDMLSIDVEGLDFRILKSIDLKKHKATFILIEESHKNIEDIINGEVYNYLKSNNYYLISKLWHTTLYKFGSEKDE